jgi:hypothetical protein
MTPMRAVIPILAVIVLATACGSRTKTLHGPDAQALRACVDRWNQGNMRGWGPARALVRGPAGERRCEVTVAFEPSTSWTCRQQPTGAYYCPFRHEADYVPVRHPNATLDKRGVLTLRVRLAGTHAPPRLAWQRYPRMDGWVDPWTAAGTFHPGLRFASTLTGGGGCSSRSEYVATGVRCLWRGLYQVDPCYAPPGRWNHRGGVVACPTGPGATSFRRFVIGPPSYRALDFPIIVPWDGIGALRLDEPRAQVKRDYDAIGHRYHVTFRSDGVREGYYVLHKSRVFVAFQDGRVDSIDFTTPFYRRDDGFGVGSRMPMGGHWEGFIWNGWNRDKPCSCWVKVGWEERSLPATPANFGKPWVFIDVRHGRVTRILLTSRFVD